MCGDDDDVAVAAADDLMTYFRTFFPFLPSVGMNIGIRLNRSEFSYFFIPPTTGAKTIMDFSFPFFLINVNT